MQGTDETLRAAIAHLNEKLFPPEERTADGLAEKLREFNAIDSSGVIMTVIDTTSPEFIAADKPSEFTVPENLATEFEYFEHLLFDPKSVQSNYLGLPGPDRSRFLALLDDLSGSFGMQSIYGAELLNIIRETIPNDSGPLSREDCDALETRVEAARKAAEFFGRMRYIVKRAHEATMGDFFIG